MTFSRDVVKFESIMYYVIKASLSGAKKFVRQCHDMTWVLARQHAMEWHGC